MQDRIEARPSRPQHPTTLSREPALLSRRETFPHHDVFSSTERFRTGTEGVLQAVRIELATNRFSVPKHFSLDRPERSTVAIASGNSIKTDRMKEILGSHNVDVIRVPEAQEWHTENVMLDATSKAHDAARILEESQEDTRRSVRQRPHVTMATDQLNAVPTITIDPATGMEQVVFKRLGKPENTDSQNPTESVRQTFQDLAALAKEYDWQTIPYIIELATVLHNEKEPENDALSIQKSVVFLSRQGIEALGNGKFDEYVERANAVLQELKEKSSAQENGKVRDIRGIAGGIVLEALEQMDIVQLITGTFEDATSLNFPSQRPEARDHAYHLALGHADERLVREYFAFPEETTE